MILALAAEMSLTIWLAAAGATVLLLPCILGPLLIKATFRMPADMNLTSVDIGQNPLPAEVARYFERIESEILLVGFEIVGHFVTHAEYGNSTVFDMMLANQRTGDTAQAMVAVAIPKGLAPMLKSRCVAFRRRFVDGTELMTSNSDMPRSFARVNCKKVVHFPQIDSAAMLFALHQRAVEEFGASLPLAAPTREQAFDELLAQAKREFADQVGAGYLRLDESNNNYVATWKGAYLMTWPIVWPVKNLLLNRRRREATALMKRWNVDTTAMLLRAAFGSR